MIGRDVLVSEAIIMSRTDTILAIVNVEARHHAGLAKAALLAQKYRTRLELFAVGGAALSVALDSLARPLRDQGLEVTTATIVADRLSAALEVRFRDPGTRFVIKDVTYGAPSSRIELTCTDWQLARTCPVPLLLSKPTLWSELPVVCAAIDPWHDDDDDEVESSDSSIIAQGAMFAERLDGELHVLHAYIPPTFVITASAADEVRALELSQGLMSTPANARLRELRSFTSGYRIPASHVHLLIGCAPEALTSFVTERGASIVVLGSVSRAALRADVIGSTAEGLLKHIPCDVLLVNRSRGATTFH